MIAAIAWCLLAAAPAPTGDLPPPVCISRAAAEACYTCHAERSALLLELQAVPVHIDSPPPPAGVPWWTLPLGAGAGLGVGLAVGLLLD